jgi:hypothetical protein
VVKVTGGAGNAARQSFSIAVQNNHSPHIASLPVATVTAGFLYRYDVHATDPDNDPLTFWLVAGPSRRVPCAHARASP